MIALTDRSRRSEAENRRDFYRINFPIEERPRILLDAPGSVRMVGEVLECSERGLRFSSPMRWLHGIGVPVSGEVMFSRGERARVAGSVVRVQGDEIALFLGKTTIPLAVILDVQRYLRTQYAGAE